MGKSEPVIDRIARKLHFSDGGCWEWTGCLVNNGYGKVGFGSASRTALVHRVVYSETVGPIPDGLHIDHLCRNRRCANPDHLEVVTQEENNRRRWQDQPRETHCKRGLHEFTPENTIPDPRGGRGCRACRNASIRKKRLTRKLIP